MKSAILAIVKVGAVRESLSYSCRIYIKLSRKHRSHSAYEDLPRLQTSVGALQCSTAIYLEYTGRHLS